MEWFSGDQHLPFDHDAGPSAVLLLHGFMGTPAEMRPLGAMLAEQGISSKAILLPGFGQDIARLADVRRTDWQATAIGAWEDLRRRYERVAVLGYSMGGALALRIAASRPIDRLILIAPLWKLLGGDLKVHALPIARHFIKEIPAFRDANFDDPGMREFFTSAMPGVNIDDPETRQHLRENVTVPTTTLDEMRALAARSPQLAKRVKASSLVIQGIADTSVFPKETRRLAASFRGPIAYHQIPGDHMLTLDDRESWPVVRDLVSGFMANGAS